MGGAVEVGLLLGATVGKTVLGFEQADAQEKALETRKKQEELKADQQAIIQDRHLESIIGTQRAEGAARGIAPTSASLSAITQDTFNQFAEDRDAANLNLQIKESAIDIAEKNTQAKAWSGAFGNLFDAANRFNNLNVPSAPHAPSGAEIDETDKQPNEESGPVDSKVWNQDQINEAIGF